MGGFADDYLFERDLLLNNISDRNTIIGRDVLNSVCLSFQLAERFRSFTGQNESRYPKVASLRFTRPI